MKKACLLLSSLSLFAWDGYDYDKSNYVAIEKGNLVRSGKEIQYYDYENGEYKNAYVDRIRDSGNKVELEVTDSDTGESRTFEMNDE
jgi:hypothetical protein